MFHSGLICTDFSDGLDRLTRFVPHLARGGLSKIVFLHSIPVWEQEKLARVDEGEIKQARERLSPALEQVPEGIEVKIDVPSGRPSETIPRVIEAENIDVVLAGTPVRSPLEETIFGSTSMELARTTTTPLMIIRPQLISVYTQEELALRCEHLWRYLLIPYNDSDSAHYLLDSLKKYAANRPPNSLQKCMLLWILEQRVRQQLIHNYKLQKAQERLESLKTELEALDIEVNIEVRQGLPLQEIIAAAIDFDISAIAIATDYRSNILDWTVASVVSEILHRIWFPLLFFSPKK